MKPDYAHRETDKLIDGLEKALTEAYGEAYQEIAEKAADYFRRFEIKDEKWRLWVEQGKKTEEQYKAWRMQQLMVGERWEKLRDDLAHDLVHADEIAAKIIQGNLPEAYALNHNWETYEIEKTLGMSTNYTLYSHDTVRKLLKKNPNLLPKPKVDIPKDLRWNQQRIQSVMLQGILQGMSIPQMAKNIAGVTDGNLKNATRNARTMMTGAQNAGRQQAMIRARKKGVKLRRTWVATLDNRTRHEHRVLDGKTVDVDKPFRVGGYEIMYPGDPSAAPEMVYNCRCTTIGQVKGFETDVRGFDLRDDPDIDGMTYAEWKKARAKSQPILHQQKVGEAIRGSYYHQYAGDD